jgi:general secretion pathway protein F
VVPRFAAVYQGGGRDLPWASQWLLSWGTFAGPNLGVLASAFVGGAVIGGCWVRAQWRRGGVSRALALLPAVRPRLQLLELSRLYLTLGMLVEGGIAVTRALALCRSVVSVGTADALELLRARVESGLPFSESLEAAGLSTPVAQRLLRVGEQSGQLGTMLTRTANFYDGETARWIDRFTRLFEPLLMAAIGLVIGLIVILLYMPVFDLAGSLQ